MKYRLFLKEEATLDAQEPFDFYEAKRKGLGTEFLNEVRIYLDKIAENPSMFRNIQSKQFANLRRFPFKIVFRVSDEEIKIYSIYHHSRNPDHLSKHD